MIGALPLVVMVVNQGVQQRPCDSLVKARASSRVSFRPRLSPPPSASLKQTHPCHEGSRDHLIRFFNYHRASWRHQ